MAVVQQLYSRTMYRVDDPLQDTWDFTFAGGYIDWTHVQAFLVNPVTGATEQITFAESALVGPFQLNLGRFLVGQYLLIMRNTPKDLPLVNFQDRGRITEQSLDRNALQAVFIAAEAADAVMGYLTAGYVDNELGYKSMKQEPYSGSSTVNPLDNGRSHYKTDAGPVFVPSSLKTTFLSTIINNSDLEMTITFEGGAVLQGVSDTSAHSMWLLAPRSLLSMTHVEVGLWFVSGNMTRL